MRTAELTIVFREAIAALDPARLVAEALRRRRLDPGRDPVTVLALGKAAARMADGVATLFGDGISGVAVTSEPADLPAGIVGFVGSHPIPDARSVAAGEALLAAAAAAPAGGLVICLVSGGGSALAEVPLPGLAIDDLAALTEGLLRSGASITEINTVRRGLSQLKGGGLARVVASPRLVTLAISDVGAAAPATIASGPTLPVAEDRAAVGEVLARYQLQATLPPGVLASAARPAPAATAPSDFEIIADGSTAARAAGAAAEARGRSAHIVDQPLSGEARQVAREVVAAGSFEHDLAIYWGETTVTVTGAGRGGRNHEAALAAAIAIAGSPAAFLAGGTDGIDGLTPGAGAAVDGNTLAEARALGIDPVAALAANDSGGFFDVVPGRIVTGPTGTNVADLWLFAAGS